MNSQLLDEPASQPIKEKIITLYGITWERFKAIEASFDSIHSVRLSYSLGILEILSPISSAREYIKITLGLLIETYMREKSIRFYKRGGFTLEVPGFGSVTPDESYSISRSCIEFPDIVIEVIISSRTINSRELYQAVGVPEVWFWKSNQIRVFHLKEDEYEEVSRSKFFPDLDLALLCRCIGNSLSMMHSRSFKQ